MKKEKQPLGLHSVKLALANDSVLVFINDAGTKRVYPVGNEWSAVGPHAPSRFTHLFDALAWLVKEGM